MFNLIKMTTKKQTTDPAKQAEQPKQFKDAFILEAELGQRLFLLLQEMPIKYSNQILPLLRELEQAPRATINVTPKPEDKEEKK